MSKRGVTRSPSDSNIGNKQPPSKDKVDGWKKESPESNQGSVPANNKKNGKDDNPPGDDGNENGKSSDEKSGFFSKAAGVVGTAAGAVGTGLAVAGALGVDPLGFVKDKFFPGDDASQAQGGGHFDGLQTGPAIGPDGQQILPGQGNWLNQQPTTRQRIGDMYNIGYKNFMSFSPYSSVNNPFYQSLPNAHDLASGNITTANVLKYAALAGSALLLAPFTAKNAGRVARRVKYTGNQAVGAFNGNLGNKAT